jgi:hypothetical protein
MTSRVTTHRLKRHNRVWTSARPTQGSQLRRAAGERTFERGSCAAGDFHQFGTLSIPITSQITRAASKATWPVPQATSST